MKIFIISISDKVRDTVNTIVNLMKCQIAVTS